MNFSTVILEEPNGPVEFRVAQTKSGELRWTAGRYLLTGKSCVRLHAEFGTRIREAINLLRSQSIE